MFTLELSVVFSIETAGGVMTALIKRNTTVKDVPRGRVILCVP